MNAGVPPSAPEIKSKDAPKEKEDAPLLQSLLWTLASCHYANTVSGPQSASQNQQAKRWLNQLQASHSPPTTPLPRLEAGPQGTVAASKTRRAARAPGTAVSLADSPGLRLRGAASRGPCGAWQGAGDNCAQLGREGGARGLLREPGQVHWGTGAGKGAP